MSIRRLWRYDGERGGPFRRCACRRWKATDAQAKRWLFWCWRHDIPKWRHWTRPMPLWWRFSTRCQGWYDCDATYGPDDPIMDYPWHIRLLFGLPKRQVSANG